MSLDALAAMVPGGTAGLLVLLSALLAVFFLAARKRAADRDRKAAANLGLAPFRRKDFYVYMKGAGFPAFLGLLKPSVSRIFRGRGGEEDVVLFTVVEPDGSSGNNRTAIALRSARWDFPVLSLTPEGISRKLLQALGREDIDFPRAPAFSRAYDLRGREEGRIRSIFRPEVLRFFEANRGFRVEARGQHVLVQKDHDLARPQDWQSCIERALAIARLLAGEVQHPGSLPQAGPAPLQKPDALLVASVLNVPINGIISWALFTAVGAGPVTYALSGVLALESLGLLLYAFLKRGRARRAFQGS
jgi:hypothetical protein